MKKVFKKIVIGILTLEAWLILKKYKPMIVAITGSVGKTSTKDSVAAVLGNKFFVRASQKSFNSEIGIPLTILGRESGWGSPIAWLKIFGEGLALIFFRNHYPTWLVIEVGTDRPGDIKSVTRWLKPDVVIVTRFGEVPVHVEFFSSREELIAEKTNLVRALKKEGTLILNADDDEVVALSHESEDARVLSYGFSPSAVPKASNLEIFYNDKGVPQGVSCKIEYQGKVFPLQLLGTIGKPHIYSSLAAFAVGISQGINMVNMLQILGETTPPKGRLRLLFGMNESVLIDDSYNSSPTAVKAALDSLGDVVTGGRKIAVLGDMLELGKESAEEHKKVGVQVAEISDILVTVGLRAELIGEEAHKKKMLKKNIYHFHDSRKAGEFLASFVEPNDIILLKGSQSIRMERAVKQLLANPEEAGNLLVRQEKEWQGK